MPVVDATLIDTALSSLTYDDVKDIIPPNNPPHAVTTTQVQIRKVCNWLQKFQQNGWYQGIREKYMEQYPGEPLPLRVIKLIDEHRKALIAALAPPLPPPGG